MTDSDRDEEFEDSQEIEQIDSQESNSPQSTAPKAKRRSKNDAGERNFKCGCGKDYLSYPALYTHIKQKHGGQQPAGTDTSTMRSHRGRGRPRKQNFPVVAAARTSGDDSFLRKEGLLGGPCDPLSECLPRSFPSPLTVGDLNKVFEAVKCIKEEGGREEQPTCNEVFGMYLVDLAAKVTKEGYRLFVLFIHELRECLNTHGFKHCSGQMTSSDMEFCEVQTTQSLPEISNFFITEFMEDSASGLEKDKAIGMMLHFNEFLFAKKFSNLKLSLIAADNS